MRRHLGRRGNPSVRLPLCQGAHERMVNTDATACVQVQTCKQRPWREGTSDRNFVKADLNDNTDDEAAATAEAHVDS